MEKKQEPQVAVNDKVRKLLKDGKEVPQNIKMGLRQKVKTGVLSARDALNQLLELKAKGEFVAQDTIEWFRRRAND